MKIIVHISEEAPPKLRALAHFLHNGAILPVRISAETEDEARTKAQELWDSEKAKWVRKLTETKPEPRKAAEVEEPGQTDLMAPPESIAAFFEDNPPPPADEPAPKKRVADLDDLL